MIALYPFCFIEMDGYHVLVDVLGVPTLKSDALGYVGDSLWDRIRSGAAAQARRRCIFVSYVVLSTVSVVGFIWLNVLFFTHAT